MGWYVLNAALTTTMFKDYAGQDVNSPMNRESV